VGDLQQKSAAFSATVGYYQSGELLIEASRDGKTWTEIASSGHTGKITGDIPASFFPAATVYIRLRADNAVTEKGDSAPGSFQINSYQYQAALNGNTPDTKGGTQYLTLQKTDSQYPVKVLSLGQLMPGPDSVQLQLSNPQQLPVRAELTLQRSDEKPLVFSSTGTTDVISVPYRFDKVGTWKAGLKIFQGDNNIYAASTEFNVASLFATDYGQRIAGSNDLWWAESAHKVWRKRPMPPANQQAAAVPIQLARNEYEAVQIIAQPQKDISNVTAKATDLSGPDGSTISSSNIQIDEVAYVHVTRPTDAVGAEGYWPDPLPPLTNPIHLKAGINQPFWVTVFAPKNIPAGMYSGKVLFSGDGWQRGVPLHVRVWNFTLTDQTHIKSALGLSAGRIAPYHNVSGDNLVKLMGKYYDDFAAHRISPYDPVYGAGIKVDWGFKQSVQWNGGAIDSQNPFKGGHSLRVDDANAHAPVQADWPVLLPIQNGKKYTLSYAVRTAKDGQGYQVTLQTYDANSKWISGNNLDLPKVGNTQWQQVSEDVSKKVQDPRVHFARVVVRAVPWSHDGEGIGTSWFDDIQLMENGATDLLDGQGSFESRVSQVTPQQVKIDFTAFDKAMAKAINERHITTFRLGIYGAGQRGKDADEYVPGHIGNYVQGSPEYNILFGSYVKQLQDHLKEKGWLDEAYLYWIDEPAPGSYKGIAEMGDTIHRYAPELKWMLTEQPEPELAHSVDIFDPGIGSYRHDDAVEMQKQGKGIWWYLSTGARAPYVGEFIDHPGIEPRLWLWQTWKNNVDGILIWDTVYWTSHAAYPDSLQNPWQDPMSWATDGSSWGNGDGRWLYPPRRDPHTDKTPDMDAPIDSIRWELLRDGIEDYEYLWTLQQQINAVSAQKNRSAAAEKWLASAKVLLQVPDSISKSLTEFTEDPQPLTLRRAEIANAIEAAHVMHVYPKKTFG
jgi:hypothetical protein